MILTVDLGTSVTKAVVWDDDGPLAIGRSTLHCTYSAGNRAEQEPASWWPSVVAACAAARAALGARGGPVFEAVGALGFAAARQTFVPVAADGRPFGPALLWSDRRAGAEAVSLAHSFGEDGADGAGASAVRRRTGVVLDAGSVAAKLTWLARHKPQTLHDARWFLSPRDLMAWRLTGEVATDHTLASATGLFELAGGALLPGLPDDLADRLPPVLPSDTMLGGLLDGPGTELGLRAGIPVVIGAGDRACEVLGTRSTEAWPMVSWGTTANVSVPVPNIDIDIDIDIGFGAAADADVDGPPAMIVTRGALQGWLLEGGLSAAGSLVDWLGRLAGLDAESVMERARSSPPGARGVIVLPWWGGARAPWWRDTARGAVVGLSFDHDIGDMARAVVESVAWDVTRCLESATRWRGEEATSPPTPPTPAPAAAPQGVVLGGGGAHVALWTEILSAVTGLPTRRRRSGEAASTGAAMLVARATGAEIDFDRMDPIEAETSPDAEMVSCYRAQRPAVDAAATAVIDLGHEHGPVNP